MATLPRYQNIESDNQTGNIKPQKSMSDLKIYTFTLTAVTLFYLFCISSFMWISFIIMFYVIGGLATYYVIAGLIPAIRAMKHLADAISQSYRLHDDSDRYVRLSKDEAPELFMMIDKVAARIGINPPENIYLEMSVDASIVLLGHCTGRGKSKLYIGYDLLAILTESEFEAVLAHELAHSKLVARGLNTWCSRGYGRAYQLNKNLAGIIDEYKRKRIKFYTASIVYSFSKKLFRLISCAYAQLNQRQELAADRLTAECCGSDVYGSALIQCSIAEYKKQSINWRDYKIYTQQKDRFCKWLRGKLTPYNDTERKKIRSYIDRTEKNIEYNTHPSLQERLESLPLYPHDLVSNAPAIQLLNNPDDVAVNYMRYIEKVISDQEKNDSIAIKSKSKKWAKYSPRKVAYTPGQIFAIVMLIIGIFQSMAGISLFFYGQVVAPIMLMIGCGLLGFGSFVYIKCSKREASPLPTPSYQAWREALYSPLRKVPECEWREEIEQRILYLLPNNIRRKHAVSAFWAEICYTMLAQCDFRGALIASEHCLAADEYRLEGLLTRAISNAWLHNTADCYVDINKAHATSIFSKSMSWGIGWALILVGDWDNAEMYLHKAVDLYSENATTMTALAITQRYRGKFYEAIDMIQRAVAICPQSIELRKTFVNTLLGAVQPIEAIAELDILDSMTKDDTDVLLFRIYAFALSGQIDRSIEIVSKLEKLLPEGYILLNIAQIFESTGYEEESINYYKKALECEYYPEALYALAQNEYKTGDFDNARKLLASAIDCTKVSGKGSNGQYGILADICKMMLAMEDEPEVSVVYKANVDLSNISSELNSIYLLICASSSDDAKNYINWIFNAMYPGAKLSENAVDLEEITDDSMSKRPRLHGIQKVQLK